MAKISYRVVVTTCDKAMWAMRPFAYLFNIYWSEQQKVDVLCESIPKFHLTDNFKFHPVNLKDHDGWPKGNWSDGVLQYLNSIKEQFVIILLDDYWLNRTADIRGVNTLVEYMHGKDVLRMDLTKDRLYAGGAHDYACYGHYDLIHAPNSPYEMSLQAAIWNKSQLMFALQPGWDPWQVELQGTTFVNSREMMVLGTRQNPVSYTNGMKNGSDEVNTSGIDEGHVKQIKKWFNKYD